MPESSEPRQVINVQPAPEQPIPYGAVYEGINSGAWAVLLVLGILFFSFRNAAINYLSNQSQLMDTLQDSLKTLADSQVRSAEESRQLSARLSSTEGLLSRILETLLKQGHRDG